LKYENLENENNRLKIDLEALLKENEEWKDKY